MYNLKYVIVHAGPVLYFPMPEVLLKVINSEMFFHCEDGLKFRRISVKQEVRTRQFRCQLRQWAIVGL